MQTIFRLLTMMLSICLLSACVSGPAYHLSRVQTKMSSQVFLPKTPTQENTVSLRYQNRSSKMDIRFSSQIVSALTKEGYVVLHDTKDAHYVLLVKLVQAGTMTSRQLKTLLRNGYGGALVNTRRNKLSPLNFKRFAVRSENAESLFKDEWYALTADIQISERVSTGQNNWNRYQTRIVSMTDTLTGAAFETVLPALKLRLSQTIAQIFQ